MSGERGRHDQRPPGGGVKLPGLKWVLAGTGICHVLRLCIHFLKTVDVASVYVERTAAGQGQGPDPGTTAAPSEVHPTEGPTEVTPSAATPTVVHPTEVPSEAPPTEVPSEAPPNVATPEGGPAEPPNASPPEAGGQESGLGVYPSPPGGRERSSRPPGPLPCEGKGRGEPSRWW